MNLYYHALNWTNLEPLYSATNVVPLWKVNNCSETFASDNSNCFSIFPKVSKNIPKIRISTWLPHIYAFLFLFPLTIGSFQSKVYQLIYWPIGSKIISAKQMVDNYQLHCFLKNVSELAMFGFQPSRETQKDGSKQLRSSYSDSRCTLVNFLS